MQPNSGVASVPQRAYRGWRVVKFKMQLQQEDSHGKPGHRHMQSGRGRSTRPKVPRRFLRARYLPAPLVLGTLLLVNGCSGSDSNSSPSREARDTASDDTRLTNLLVGSRLRRLGISISLPNGWRGSIEASHDPGGLPAVLKASNFPPPEQDDDFGSNASRAMRKGDLRIILFEFPAEQAGRHGFVAGQRPIAVDRGDLGASPATFQHALAKVRFAINSRPFSLFVEFSDRSPSGAEIARVNEILSTIEIQRRPETNPLIWRPLRRELRLPRISPGAPCPRTSGGRPAPQAGWALGPGPAYPVLGSTNGFARLRDDRVRNGRYLHKTLWAIAPRYSGPVLVRGQRLGVSATALRFTERMTLELRFPAISRSGEPFWRYTPTYTAIAGPGCYAFQIDGHSFSKVLVFHALK